ncbi:MAG: lysophospholipid acyltransferase family protein [bacterium]|nr:lysophospholipid acyltransferase family protein [bacterium]
MEVLGIENVPMQGGIIVASNHISHLDPPAIGSALPRKSYFVAKSELFEQVFLNWYLPRIGVIPIKRGGGGSNIMLDRAAEIVRKGNAISFFPEGTRSKTGMPGRPRTGVIVLAAMTGAPILPARVSGTYDAMPPGSIIPHGGKVQVAFGEPIRWQPGELNLEDRTQMLEEAKRLFDAIFALPGWHPKKAKIPVNSKPEAAE